MTSYKIIRFSVKGNQKVVRRGLSFGEAKRHCNMESTHKRDKNGYLVWFDGFTVD